MCTCITHALFALDSVVPQPPNLELGSTSELTVEGTHHVLKNTDCSVIGIAEHGEGGLRLSVLYRAVKVRELVGGHSRAGVECVYGSWSWETEDTDVLMNIRTSTGIVWWKAAAAAELQYPHGEYKASSHKVERLLTIGSEMQKTGPACRSAWC